MIDYTDISGKIEDIQSSLNDLYDLIEKEYGGVFEGEEQEKYVKLLEIIKSSNEKLDDATDINSRLADAYEDKFLGDRTEQKSKRTLDKTKKANIKCEHCEYWGQVCSETGWIANKYALGCTCPSSPKYNQVTNYWNRCKSFEWKKGI